jgi:transcriptional regulator with XRE-family HTH domain
MLNSELRSRRQKLYLSQAGLAARLHVAPNTVARWERGELAIPPFLREAMRMHALDLEEEQRSWTDGQWDVENTRRLRRFREHA